MSEDGRSLPILGQDGTGRDASDGDPASPSAGRDDRRMTPLQAELLEEGALPDPDELGRAMHRPALAEEAGYGEGGPRPLGGPGGRSAPGPAGPEESTDDPPIPVHQWDVDPRSDDLPVEEVQAERDDWDYRMWWQEHPSGLVYASLQALRSGAEKAEPPARAHPVGRAVAVNLVYDTERGAVVAVYGTARDFRPFVAAFWEAYADRNDVESAGPTTGAPDDDADREHHPNETEAG